MIALALPLDRYAGNHPTVQVDGQHAPRSIIEDQESSRALREDAAGSSVSCESVHNASDDECCG